MSKNKTYGFYDLKVRDKVQAEVISKEIYGTNKSPRYALRGKTKDGRTLSSFVKKEVYDKY